MFDLVQKYKRLIQLFLGLIALTFATWGIESYTRFRGAGDAVASVNGLEIPRREFDDEMLRQQEQLRQMFGPTFNTEAFDTPEARRALLDGLISQRLVSSVAVKSYLTVSDETLREVIASIPAFQDGGKFSRAAYENMLRLQNPPMSPAQYESRLRHDLALQQLMRAVGGAAIPSRAVVDRLATLEAQKREVSEARITAQQYLPQVKIDEAKLKEYYDANPAEFRTPERVRAEYVVLSAEQLARQEQVPEDEIKAAYQARQAQLTQTEQRRASHILVKTKEEADKLVAELKKSPTRFAELAKKQSQDPGSAEKGGDLGWFGRGMMVKPFEDAVFAMKQGETAAVQSEFGVHVIRLTGVQAAKARSLDEARAEIEADLKKTRSARRFNETADAFANMVYEQADSLKPAAERFKLPIQATGWIVKSANQELGALDNPKLLAALFSSDALVNKRNTDAIEVAPATLVSARVVEHQAAAQRSFVEVKADLAEVLRRREAVAIAQKDGMTKLDLLRKGADAGVTWGTPRTVSRRDARGMPPEIARQVAAADVTKLPAYVGVATPDAGYVLVRISKVIEAEAAEKTPENEQRIANTLSAAQYQAYVGALRERADIEVRSLSPEKK